MGGNSEIVTEETGCLVSANPQPKEVASAINYLFSEDASYITGQVISVNGGMY